MSGVLVFLDSDVGCTIVKEDKIGAIHLAEIPATTLNSKHIDVRHHFLRERVGNGEFKIVHVSPGEQHADFLTKALVTEAFRLLCGCVTWTLGAKNFAKLLKAPHEVLLPLNLRVVRQG